MLSKNLSLVLGLRRIRLPVIQEEEGSIVNDGKSQLPVFSDNEKIENKKNYKTITIKKNVLKKENIKRQGKPSPLKLPPLSDANYSRNSGSEQSIPGTSKNFMKNLSNRKATNKSKVDTKIKKNHSPTLKSLLKSGGKCKIGHSLKPMEPLARKTSNCVPSVKTQDKSNGSSFEKTSLPDKTKRSSKLMNKKNQNGLTKEIIKDKTAISTETAEKRESCAVPKNSENAEGFIKELEVCRQTLSQSLFSRNQTFLTDCIKTVVKNDLISNACELCQEAFKTVEDLLTHKKNHEKEKEVCLLCDQIFFNSKDFINHLLTHDGIDRFNCETCGKYFLSGKKYRDHCKEFHLLYSGNKAMSQISSQFVVDSPNNSPSIHKSKHNKKR